jgi:ABC-2 type transport system permease protein
MPIFDQGYQHWSGELSSHLWRWLAITKHGVRAGLKNRWTRMMLLAAWSPALALATLLCIWGLIERKAEVIKPVLQSLQFLGRQVVADPRHYRVEIWTICYEYFLLTEVRFSMILILLVGPGLISQDLRFNALPLYFSRPLRRIDYFMGKLGVIAALLGMVVIAPSIVAYILGLLFSLDITIIRDTYRLLLSSVAYGLIVSFSAGLLILALSSLSRNSRYIALFWMGIWLVTSITAGILSDVARDQRRHEFFAQTESRTPIWLRMHDRNWQDFQQRELKSSATDWRPIVSYTEDLSRIGRKLLNSQASWESLSQLQPPGMRANFLLLYSGASYPWYWSAGVLIGLFGISACILNSQVKSLDRLK